MSLTMESSMDHRFSSSQPYAVLDRKERSRELAQKRRSTYKTLMQDLADELPFSKDVVSQVDYNSRLRLALCFFRAKNLLRENLEDFKNESVFDDALFQELLIESLDGFLLVIMGDGNIIYLSQSVHKHLGLFQSEHIGYSVYDLIHEDDQQSVKTTLTESETKLLSGLEPNSTVTCSFFCRMKCSRFKVSNTATKSPGYKLVFVSGRFKLQGNRPYLLSVVRPVSPPSILEIRMEGNMFVTHYNLQMKCIFFDGRLHNLMGYDKSDMIGHVPFEFHHHADVDATVECSKGIMEKGEALSGYYRYLNKFGHYVWVQSRATMMFDSRTGQPSYIVCMNYIISKQEGEKSLELRQVLAAGEGVSMMESTRSHDPFPVPREDHASINPLHDMPIITEETDSRTSSPSSPDSRSISPDSVAISTPNSSVSGYIHQQTNQTEAHTNSSQTEFHTQPQPPTKNTHTDFLSALNTISQKKSTSSVLSDMGYYSGDSPVTNSPVPSETALSNTESYLIHGTPLPNDVPSSKRHNSELLSLLLDHQTDHTPTNQSPVSASPQGVWPRESSHLPATQPGSQTTVYPMQQDSMTKQPYYLKSSENNTQLSANSMYQSHYTPSNMSFQMTYKTEPFPTNIPAQYSPYIAPTDVYSIQGYNLQSSPQVGLPLWNMQPSQFFTQLNSRTMPAFQ